MGRLPLAGIRVLDNGIVQAGTFPARLLADFGAEVVRVENYARPDLSRNSVFPGGIPGDPYWEGGGVYHEQFRNKQLCIGLDVRKPEGRDAFLRLVKTSDIVLDSHPPGVMEKLNLDYPALKAVNPKVIYVSTSGYGYGGPFSPVRSYGMMTEAMCGSAFLNGYEGEESRRGACPLTDHPATYHCAFLMMAALVRRKRTGEGTWLDISQYEVGTNFIGDAHLAHALGAPVPTRTGSVDAYAPFSGVFRCAGDDMWVAVSVTSDAMWASLCAAAGLAKWAGRRVTVEPLSKAERNEVGKVLTAWTSSQTAHEAFVTLGSAGVAASTVNSVRELLLDPHLKERGFFWEIQHAPEQNVGMRAWPGASAVMSKTPAQFQSRAPMLGEHNRKVATELLGYSAGEFDSMEASGAFGTVPAAAAMKPPPTDIPGRLNLAPAAATARVRTVDERHMERLRERFGSAYGR